MFGRLGPSFVSTTRSGNKPWGDEGKKQAIWGELPRPACWRRRDRAHYDGAAGLRLTSGDISFLRPWKWTANELWVAGDRGHVLHWDGAAWWISGLRAKQS